MMAIPPIIAKIPLFKLFRADNSPAVGKKAETGVVSGQTRQDIVEISAAAQQRLAGVHSFSSEGEARDAAQETGTILKNSDYTLGLDPQFPS